MEMGGFHCNLFVLAFPDGVIISEFKVLLSYSQPWDAMPTAGVIESSTLFGPSSKKGHDSPSWLRPDLVCTLPFIGSTEGPALMLLGN